MPENITLAEFTKRIQDEKRADFVRELATVVNKHSRENGSNTPDFILANFLADQLDAFDKAVGKRDRWLNG